MLNSFKSLSVGGIALKQLFINGVLAWKQPSSYKNQVPVSINADGTIFNNVGYQESLRLSSNGTTKEKNNSVVTGFIPAKGGDVIRVAGVYWSYPSSANYICAYTSSFTHIGARTSGGSEYTTAIVESVSADGEISIIRLAEVDDIAYIRISSCGDDTTQALGSEMIVTVNEEIAT